MNYDAGFDKKLEMELTGGMYVITYVMFALFLFAGFLVHRVLF